MKWKVSDDRYIYAIGDGENPDGISISEAEYLATKNALSNAPYCPAGFCLFMKTDLTFEVRESPPLPPDPEDEATSEDYEAALGRLGVET